METKEKILVLGALFHDIGKFEQRVTNKHIPHSELGGAFLEELRDELIGKILNSEEAFQRTKKIITEHHNKNSDDELVNIVRQADHLSASERVNFDEEDKYEEKWSHKFLTSLFTKISLTNKDENVHKPRYYAQRLLTEKNYKILIPEYETEQDIKETKDAKYQNNIFERFLNDIRAVLNFYKNEDDFTTLINWLLVVLEKYLWCIPDFTGSENTDISLYNHLKDVAGLSLAIYKSNSDEPKLNLIIGDIPGIQKYIFNVTYKKPAKILRGRSIFVQILTRRFATKVLNKFDLTDANLIMLAGGKFYIVAQNYDKFSNLFNEVKEEIEETLVKNFNYQLGFSIAAHSFNYEDLMNGKTTFGNIIDETSYELLKKRNQQFENILFEKGDFDEDEFILNEKYVEPDESGISDSIKCAVTNLPIRKWHVGYIEENNNKKSEKIRVDKQVEYEYLIGSFTPKNNVVIELSEDLSEVTDVKRLKDYKTKGKNKILINPDLDELLSSKNLEKDILRNTQVIEVANYTSREDKDNSDVMDFKEMEKLNNGAEIMTLIKGDVDNLGLIMSTGLVDDSQDLTAISRTTTLSNHLKYFFSFSLNGFLEDWEKGKILDEEEQKIFTKEYLQTEEGKEHFEKYIQDRKVYTVFAGGDDLMMITPQSSSLKLLYEFNKTFSDFVCNNPEVHISYSLTNFKHNTPIRIVAEIAEENQNKAKEGVKINEIIKGVEANNENIFSPEYNKATFRIFDTNVKNELMGQLLAFRKKLIEWEEDDSNKITAGILRNLLIFSKIIKDFNEKHDTRMLMWHPHLTYMINRLLKDKENKYYNPEVGSFFDLALRINKMDNREAQILEKILYAVVSEAIYGTRKTKKGE